MKGQRELCIDFLEKAIDRIYEEAEEGGLPALQTGKAEFGLTSLEMLLGVIKANDIKEPLDDVVIFAGYPEADSPCCGRSRLPCAPKS